MECSRGDADIVRGGAGSRDLGDGSKAIICKTAPASAVLQSVPGMLLFLGYLL
jgi:hypothetical protein